MLYDIGCNILDAFNHIYECTGEHNPNSIFEAGNATPKDRGMLKVSDILDLFNTDTDEHKENRIKLARLVYGSNGEPFTLETTGESKWTVKLSNDGDKAVEIDSDGRTANINAKLSAYTKSAANFLANPKKDGQYNKTKSPFQKSIDKLGNTVGKAINGQDTSRDAMDSEVTQNDDTTDKQSSAKQSQPSTQNEIYSAIVRDFKNNYRDQIPADCEDNLNMSREDVDELAHNYYGQIVRNYPTADGQTEDKAIKYIRSSINSYLRYENARMGNTNPNAKSNDGDGEDDGMVWYKPTDEKKGNRSSKGSSGKDSSWVKRQLDTSEVHRKAFTW